MPKVCQHGCQIECQIDCQKKCQIDCQVECQIECQVECQIRCQVECEIKCQIECDIECQIDCHTNVRIYVSQSARRKVIICQGGDHSKKSNSYSRLFLLGWYVWPFREGFSQLPSSPFHVRAVHLLQLSFVAGVEGLAPKVY